MLTFSMYIGLVEERKKVRETVFLQVSTTLRPLSRFRGSAWGEKHLGVRGKVCLVKFSISRDLPVKCRRFLNAL